MAVFARCFSGALLMTPLFLIGIHKSSRVYGFMVFWCEVKKQKKTDKQIQHCVDAERRALVRAEPSQLCSMSANVAKSV